MADRFATGSASLPTMLADLSVWVPCTVAFYAVVRWFALPTWSVILVLLGWYLLSRSHSPRECSISSREHLAPHLSRVDGVLFMILVAFLLIPTSVRFLETISVPTRSFYFYDEAYDLAIARGLERSLPPPDLLFAGQTQRYHPGGPLLVEAISRFTGLSIFTVFYGVLPPLARLLYLGASWRLFGRLFPEWSARRRLMAVAVSCGLFFIDPLAFAWNLRNWWIIGQLSWETWTQGVPVAGWVPLPAATAPVYGAPLATVFLLGTLAGGGVIGSLPVGAALATVYLVKSQIGLPAFLGFTCAAIALFLRRSACRDWHGALVAAAAVPFLLFARSLGPRTDDLIVEFGLGAGLRSIVRAGEPFAAGMGTPSPNMAFLCGTILFASRWIVLAAPAVLAARWVAQGQWDSRRVGIWLAGPLLTLAAFASLLIIHPSHELRLKFEATHFGIRDQLWLPYHEYLDRLNTDVSVGVASGVVLLLVGLFAAGGWVELERRARSKWLRVSARVSIGLATAVFVSASLHAAGPGRRAERARQLLVAPDLVAALAVIPLDGTTILTNDLAYDRVNAPHQPLVHPTLAALHGHQFWAADFMFDLHYPNVAERFHAWRRFWETPSSTWHRELLAQEEIEWILERRQQSRADPLLLDGVTLVLLNDTYRVLRVASPIRPRRLQ
jgi:hypothetical protein